MQQKITEILRRGAFFCTHMCDLRDLFAFGGLGLMGYGIALIFMPGGFIVIGAGLFWLGVRKVA